MHMVDPYFPVTCSGGLRAFCRVVDLSQREDGSWDVVTEKGNIHAEHVVNCGGLWARECARMVGLELPVLAMEHMYLLTEDMPEVAEANAALNDATTVMVQFENAAALARAEEIVAVPGVDMVMIGTNDLLADWGMPEQYEHPRVREAYAQTIAVGVHLLTPPTDALDQQS